MRQQAAVVLLSLAVAGCGGALADSVHTASQSAVDTLTSPQDMQKWDALAASAAGAARDAMLDDETNRRLQLMISALAETLRTELVTTRDALLDAQLRSEVDALRAELLGDGTRKLVRQMIDDALAEETTGAELDALREHLVGAALRTDVDALIDEAGPRLGKTLAASLAPAQAQLQAQADTEGAKLLHVAEGFGAAIILMVVVAVFVLRRHGSRLEAIERHIGKAAS